MYSLHYNESVDERKKFQNLSVTKDEYIDLYGKNEKTIQPMPAKFIELIQNYIDQNPNAPEKAYLSNYLGENKLQEFRAAYEREFVNFLREGHPSLEQFGLERPEDDRAYLSSVPGVREYLTNYYGKTLADHLQNKKLEGSIREGLGFKNIEDCYAYFRGLQQVPKSFYETLFKPKEVSVNELLSQPIGIDLSQYTAEKSGKLSKKRVRPSAPKFPNPAEIIRTEKERNELQARLDQAKVEAEALRNKIAEREKTVRQLQQGEMTSASLQDTIDRLMKEKATAEKALVTLQLQRDEKQTDIETVQIKNESLMQALEHSKHVIEETEKTLSEVTDMSLLLREEKEALEKKLAEQDSKVKNEFENYKVNAEKDKENLTTELTNNESQKKRLLEQIKELQAKDTKDTEQINRLNLELQKNEAEKKLVQERFTRLEKDYQDNERKFSDKEKAFRAEREEQGRKLDEMAIQLRKYEQNKRDSDRKLKDEKDKIKALQEEYSLKEQSWKTRFEKNKKELTEELGKKQAEIAALLSNPKTVFIKASEEEMQRVLNQKRTLEQELDTKIKLWEKEKQANMEKISKLEMQVKAGGDTEVLRQEIAQLKKIETTSRAEIQQLKLDLILAEDKFNLQKASELKKLKNEKEDLEDRLSNQVSELKRQQRSNEMRIKELENELTEKTDADESRVLKEEIRRLKREKSESEAEYESQNRILKSDIAMIQNKLIMKESELNEAKSKPDKIIIDDKYRQQLEEARRDQLNQTNLIEKLEAEKKDLVRKLQRMEENRVRISELESQKQDLEVKNNELQSQISSSANDPRIIELTRQSATYQSRIVELEDEMRKRDREMNIKLTDKEDELKREIDRLNRELGSKKIVLQQYEKRQSKDKDTLEDLQLEILELQRNKKTIQEQLNSKENEISLQSQKLQVKEHELIRQKNEIYALQLKIQDSAKLLERKEIDLRKLSGDKSTEINELNSKITDLEENMKQMKSTEQEKSSKLKAALQKRIAELEQLQKESEGKNMKVLDNISQDLDGVLSSIRQVLPEQLPIQLNFDLASKIEFFKQIFPQLQAMKQRTANLELELYEIKNAPVPQRKVGFPSVPAPQTDNKWMVENGVSIRFNIIDLFQNESLAAPGRQFVNQCKSEGRFTPQNLKVMRFFQSYISKSFIMGEFFGRNVKLGRDGWTKLKERTDFTPLLEDSESDAAMLDRYNQLWGSFATEGPGWVGHVMSDRHDEVDFTTYCTQGILNILTDILGTAVRSEGGFTVRERQQVEKSMKGLAKTSKNFSAMETFRSVYEIHMPGVRRIVENVVKAWVQEIKGNLNAELLKSKELYMQAIDGHVLDPNEDYLDVMKELLLGDWSDSTKMMGLLNDHYSMVQDMVADFQTYINVLHDVSVKIYHNLKQHLHFGKHWDSMTRQLRALGDRWGRMALEWDDFSTRAANSNFKPVSHLFRKINQDATLYFPKDLNMTTIGHELSKELAMSLSAVQASKVWLDNSPIVTPTQFNAVFNASYESVPLDIADEFIAGQMSLAQIYMYCSVNDVMLAPKVANATQLLQAIPPRQSRVVSLTPSIEGIENVRILNYSPIAAKLPSVPLITAPETPQVLYRKMNQGESLADYKKYIQETAAQIRKQRYTEFINTFGAEPMVGYSGESQIPAQRQWYQEGIEFIQSKLKQPPTGNDLKQIDHALKTLSEMGQHNKYNIIEQLGNNEDFLKQMDQYISKLRDQPYSVDLPFLSDSKAFDDRYSFDNRRYLVNRAMSTN